MLKGKIIINTRPKGSEDLIGNALKELGALVLPMPLINILPIQLSKKVLLDITKDNAYQWLIFTSKNGVDLFFDQLALHHGTASLPFKTAVFGKRTASSLIKRGFKPDLVSLQNTSADLLSDLNTKLQPNDKLLLILGDMASGLLENGLKSMVNVDRLNVYRTVFIQSVNVEMLHRIIEGKYDLILFTSPSGFKSFLQHTAGTIENSKLRIACLGPTTEKAILDEGLKPLVVASPSGKIGLIKVIENYFQSLHAEQIK